MQTNLKWILLNSLIIVQCKENMENIKIAVVSDLAINCLIALFTTCFTLINFTSQFSFLLLLNCLFVSPFKLPLVNEHNIMKSLK